MHSKTEPKATENPLVTFIIMFSYTILNRNINMMFKVTLTCFFFSFLFYF